MRIKIFLPLIAVLLICVHASAQKVLPDSSIVKPTDDLKFKYSFVPLPSFDPSTKWGISLTNLFTYKVNMNDSISPYSMGGVALQLTSNGSMMLGGGTTMYLNEDKWRVSVFGLVGRVHQDLDLEFGHDTRSKRLLYLINAQGLRQVYRRLYLGLGYSYRKVVYKGRNDEANEELQEIGLYGGEGNHGIKYLITQDKRDNVIYPYHGYYAAARVEQYLKSNIASAYLANYIEFRHFIDVGDQEGKHIIAYKFLGRFLGGDPLEQNYSYYGRTGGDIERGYETGEYIDRDLVNLEAEYRLRTTLLKSKLGFVGFTGIGKVFGHYNDFSDAEWLPMIGGGLRYCIVPQTRMNVRFDVAGGKEGVVVYFGIREAF